MSSSGGHILDHLILKYWETASVFNYYFYIIDVYVHYAL